MAYTCGIIKLTGRDDQTTQKTAFNDDKTVNAGMAGCDVTHLMMTSLKHVLRSSPDEEDCEATRALVLCGRRLPVGVSPAPTGGRA